MNCGGQPINNSVLYASKAFLVAIFQPAHRIVATEKSEPRISNLTTALASSNCAIPHPTITDTGRVKTFWTFKQAFLTLWTTQSPSVMLPTFEELGNFYDFDLLECVRMHRISFLAYYSRGSAVGQGGGCRSHTDDFLDRALRLSQPSFPCLCWIGTRLLRKVNADFCPSADMQKSLSRPSTQSNCLLDIP